MTTTRRQYQDDNMMKMIIMMRMIRGGAGVGAGGLVVGKYTMTRKIRKVPLDIERVVEVGYFEEICTMTTMITIMILATTKEMMTMKKKLSQIFGPIQCWVWTMM